MSTVKAEKRIIKKQISKTGRYLLGEDQDGVKLWLTPASWDCGWYWGFGYIHEPHSHTHVDSSLMGKQEIYDHEKGCWKLSSDYVNNIFDSPRFSATTFTEKEGWTLSELFKSFYILKETAEFCHTGGAHLTNNPLQSILKNEAEEDRINKDLLPKIFEEIYKILRP